MATTFEPTSVQFMACRIIDPHPTRTLLFQGTSALQPLAQALMVSHWFTDGSKKAFGLDTITLCAETTLKALSDAT